MYVYHILRMRYKLFKTDFWRRKYRMIVYLAVWGDVLAYLNLFEVAELAGTHGTAHRRRRLKSRLNCPLSMRLATGFVGRGVGSGRELDLEGVAYVGCHPFPL